MQHKEKFKSSNIIFLYKVVITFIFVLIINVSFATGTKTWKGTFTTAWATAANWSPAAVPIAGDDIVFDNTSSNNCVMPTSGTALPAFLSFTLAANNTRTITMGLAITVTGAFSISGGTFSASANILTIGGNWTQNGGTFTPSTGTVTFNGTGAQTINGTAASQTFYNVVIAKTAGTLLNFGGSTTTFTTQDLTETTGNFTAPATLNINGNLTLTAGTFTAGTNTNIKGNWTNNGGTFTPGTNTTTFNGTGAQTINGTAASQTFYNVVIAKTAGTLLNFGGSTTTFTTQDLTETTGNFTAPATLNINGNLTLTAGTFTAGTNTNIKGNWTNNGGTFTSGSNTVTFNGTTQSITAGTSSYNNVTFNPTGGAGVVTINGTAVVNGTLVLSGSSNSLTFNAGTTPAEIQSKAGITLSNTSTSGGGTATININGTGAQTITSSLSIGQCVLPSVKIVSSNTVTLPANLTVGGNWIYTSGTLSIPGASTIMFSGNWSNKTISGGASNNYQNITFNPSGHSTFNIGALNVAATLTLSGSYNIVLNGGEIQAKAGVTLTNTATDGGGNATLTLNGTGSQTITSSLSLGQCQLPSFKINKSSGTLTLPNNLTMAGNLTYLAGTMSLPGGSTIRFTGSPGPVTTINAGSSPFMTFQNVQISSPLMILANPLTVAGNLTIDASKMLNVGSNYQINLAGNWTNSGQLVAGSGLVLLNGSSAQSINGSATTSFYKLQVNKTGSSALTLNTPAKITNELILTSGIVNSTSTNIVKIDAGAIVSGTSNSSFVSGPVEKTGNTAFIFPVGKTNKYLPIIISAPPAISNALKAEAFLATPPSSGSLLYPIAALCSCQYWNVAATSGTPNIQVTLPWDANTCATVVPSIVGVARYNGTQWVDAGENNLVPTLSNGSITSDLTTSYGNFTFGSASDEISYASLKKEIDGSYCLVPGYDLFRFKFDEEYYVPVTRNLRYKVYSKTNVDVTSSTSLANDDVKYGDNRYILDVTSLTSGEFFILEVQNEKNEKWYLRFKVY